jgi:hypothetical protein
LLFFNLFPSTYFGGKIHWNFGHFYLILIHFLAHLASNLYLDFPIIASVVPFGVHLLIFGHFGLHFGIIFVFYLHNLQAIGAFFRFLFLNFASSHSLSASIQIFITHIT